MLDVLQSGQGQCERCGKNRLCAKVDFWDDSFYGWLCWIELMQLVNDASKDPFHRKTQAGFRKQRLLRQGWMQAQNS